MRHGGTLGVAATRHQRTDRSADGPAAHVRAERGDDAGDFETGKIRRARRRRILPQPLDHVGTIHAGRGDVDQDFAGRGNRIRPLDEFEDVRRTERGDLDCFHFSPDGRRGDISSAMNSRQRRCGVFSRPIFRST